MTLRTADELQRLANRRLPPFLAEYVNGGSYAEHTLRRNVEDLRSIELRQRVLCDVSNVTLGTTLFGRECALPLGLGPIGISGMLARRGEVQAARAAEQVGVPFCLSTVSICSIEEVRAALKRPFWFQLYMIRDRGFMSELLDRATAAGCSTLVFTVDMPVPGVRYRDFRSGMAGSGGWRAALRRGWQGAMHPRWGLDVGLAGRPHSLGNLIKVLGKNSGLEDYIGWLGRNFDPSVTWHDLEWVRARWRGPLVLKGVLDVDDARAAASSSRITAAGSSTACARRRVRCRRSPTRSRAGSRCSPTAACERASTCSGCSRSARTACCSAGLGLTRSRPAAAPTSSTCSIASSVSSRPRWRWPDARASRRSIARRSIVRGGPDVYARGLELTMTLASGTRLGVYEISSPLGAGGMGEVYRATVGPREVARVDVRAVLDSRTGDGSRCAR
jgi:isopentenyl diphosphate isomerase/L-lactate dehydrogenase-like FMN-dependent dehydrogenase